MPNKLPPRQVEFPMSEREKELEAIVREFYPAAREILWCALVWNDHNFREKDLFNHAVKAAKELGFDRLGVGENDGINKANIWMERIEYALEMPSVEQQKGSENGG